MTQVDVVFTESKLRKCVYDPNVKTLKQVFILPEILKTIQEKESNIYNINCIALAKSLSELDKRFSKVVMEIIIEYHLANQVDTGPVHVMGKKNKIPYDGKYVKSNNHTILDLDNFPDTLVIIIYEFMRLKSKNS